MTRLDLFSGLPTVILPSILLYVGVCYLTLLPNTQYIRFGAIPIAAWLAYRALTEVLIVSIFPYPGSVQICQFLYGVSDIHSVFLSHSHRQELDRLVS